MTIQSLSTALTPQQILQLLQKTQVGNADAEQAGAAAEKAAVTGQDVPGATDASAEAASGGATPAPQETLDPKTILALLKIQESQARAQVNAQLFSGDDGTGDGTGAQNLFGLGDPNTAFNTGTNGTGGVTDPFLQAMNADPSKQGSIDPMLSLLGQMTSSANAGSALSTTNQSLLDLLNRTAPSAMAEQSAAATTAAEQEA